MQNLNENMVALACACCVLDFEINGPAGNGGPLSPNKIPDRDLAKRMFELGKASRRMLQFYRYRSDRKSGFQHVDAMQDISLERLEMMTTIAKIVWTAPDPVLGRLGEAMEQIAEDVQPV